MLTGGSDRAARLWNPATGTPIGPTMEHPAAVAGLAFSPDDRLLLTAATDGGLRVWDRATGFQIGPTLPHGPSLAGASFSADGHRVYGFGGSVSIWPTPPALGDDPEPITDAVRALAAMELAPDASVRMMNPKTWESLDGASAARSIAPPLSPTEWHERLASQYERSERPRSARWHLDRLIADHPGNWWYHARRASVREALGDTAGAEADESRAAVLGPPDRILSRAMDREWPRLARAEADRRWGDALRLLDALLARDPGNADLLQRRAEVWAQAGNLAESAADFATSLTQSSPIYDYYRLALLRMSLGDVAGYRDVCRLLKLRMRDSMSDETLNACAWIVCLGPDAIEDSASVLPLIEQAMATLRGQARIAGLNTLGAALVRAGRPRDGLRFLDESIAASGGTSPQTGSSARSPTPSSATPARPGATLHTLMPGRGPTIRAASGTTSRSASSEPKPEGSSSRPTPGSPPSRSRSRVSDECERAVAGVRRRRRCQVCPRQPTPTVSDSQPTPTVSDSQPTPTVSDSQPTPTVSDSQPTPTVSDSQPTPDSFRHS